MLLRYPEVFPLEFVEKDLFMNVYAQVCTRCFGYGLDSTSMIPMADNLNHSSVDITYELINESLHKEGTKHPLYYRVYKFINDYRYLPEGKDFLNGRFDRKVFE
jgi:hypothetical protein